ncbi:hypothetical protein [Pseudarthrobacter chlorophenolicus]|uniref:hypothetical protein n=1 Tax=Pseudarthrobacter chlorophenolicus TaxID=85085 RepID=UPI0009E5636C|nr:hypothetical protein [Pseudarthrobacter chlorophenolicus]
MRQSTTIHDAFISDGLLRLQKEAFSEGGPGYGAEAVVSTSWIQQTLSRRYEDVQRNGQWGYPDFDAEFSYEAMDSWLLEVRARSYVPGEGTWITYRVHLYPQAEGHLEVFDEELLSRGLFATPGEEDAPSDAETLKSELIAFPRTAENIPSWMWNTFRTAGVTPPLYNSELNAVEWDNRRRKVTERGTDFTEEPTVIDAHLEPGLFGKIGRKLFGQG